MNFASIKDIILVNGIRLCKTCGELTEWHDRTIPFGIKGFCLKCACKFCSTAFAFVGQSRGISLDIATTYQGGVQRTTIKRVELPFTPKQFVQCMGRVARKGNNASNP